MNNRGEGSHSYLPSSEEVGLASLPSLCIPGAPRARRFADWEVKGVPLRLELGPKVRHSSPHTQANLSDPKIEREFEVGQRGCQWWLHACLSCESMKYQHLIKTPSVLFQLAESGGKGWGEGCESFKRTAGRDFLLGPQTYGAVSLPSLFFSSSRREGVGG